MLEHVESVYAGAIVQEFATNCFEIRYSAGAGQGFFKDEIFKDSAGRWCGVEYQHKDLTRVRDQWFAAVIWDLELEVAHIQRKLKRAQELQAAARGEPCLSK